MLQVIHSSKSLLTILVYSNNVTFLLDALMKAGEQIPQRKPSPLGLFWPNTVAECDTSFLEGSDIYTPSKLPYFKSTNDIVLIPNMNSNYGSMSRQRNNNAPNSCNRVAASSQSSNSRSGSTSPKLVQSPQPHMTLPSQCYLGGQSPIVLGFTPGPTIIPVYNHTGSPDSSDVANDTNNETRV
jgi:hypothetical protein